MNPSPQGYVDYSLPTPLAHGPMLRFQTPRPRHSRTNPPSVGLFPQGFTAPAPVCYPQEAREATPRHRPATGTWGPNMTIPRPLDAATAAFGHTVPPQAPNLGNLPMPHQQTIMDPGDHAHTMPPPQSSIPPTHLFPSNPGSPRTPYGGFMQTH